VQINVLLIDDHPLFRSGIAGVVGTLASAVQLTEVSSCESALALIDSGGSFDLVLLDLNLPGMDGMTGLSRLRDAAPATPIVVLSATESMSTIRQAIASGAKGYIPKSAPAEIILGALRLVLSGGIYLPLNVMAGGVLAGESHSGTEQDESALTPRQHDVLQWLARGNSNKEIAARLGMAENTVRVHVAAILKYLGVRNRTEAGVAARGRRLLDDPLSDGPPSR
jgi:DNA-binding NarL/FixJ family response regulator